MELNKDNFVSETSEGLVLLDFWAEWCGPCQGMMPVLADFEQKTGIKVGKIDVDAEPELAQEHRVMSIPTLVWMKDGKAVDQTIGAQTLEQLQETADKHK